MKKHSTKFLPVVILNTNDVVPDISRAHSSILEDRSDIGASFSTLFG